MFVKKDGQFYTVEDRKGDVAKVKVKRIQQVKTMLGTFRLKP